VHHLVLAQALDDDGGEADELAVIWEIEPGAEIHERAALPDPTRGFDRPEIQGAFLDAVRWAAIATADTHVLHAPFRSGITIEDYQLDPVARALQMPRVNLLIADDVGLGKTIEAGLVVQELTLRHRVRTVFVVCPAGLQIQWRDQMRDKFGLEFKIVDSALLRELRRTRGPHVNPWNHHPRLITSIDYLKRERPLRLLRDLLPAEGEAAYPRCFDLLIVDEAHNIAPAGRGHYALDSGRTAAIRALAPHFEHKLFLSATPHNGYPESFAALLELLDNQRFHRGMRSPDPRQLAAVMVRRLKRELPPDDLGRPRFPARRLLSIEIDYPQAELRAHANFQRYVELSRSLTAADDEGFAAEFILKLLKKRLFSSPEAFKLTLERHLAARRGLPAARLSAPERPSRGLLEREIAGAEEESADDDAYEAQNLEVVDTATRALRPLSSDEEDLLVDLSNWAERASAAPDAKAHALLDFLDREVRPGGQWSDTRVIIFTEYRATQNWLLGLLAAHRLTEGERTLAIYGGMDPLDRERVKAAFQADPAISPVRILVATDAASEGIDLQNHCSRLIHYELPWNPSRMEQRNGRVDRHGQRAGEVQVFHFVGRGFRETDPEAKPGDLAGDHEFLMRIALRVDKIREDLGSVGDLLAAEVEAAMLGRPVAYRAAPSDARRDQAHAVLKLERDLRRHLERLRQNLDLSRTALHLAPARLQAVVELGLQLAGQRPLRPTTVAGTPAFFVPPLGGTWAACAVGLAHPHTGQIRPIVFDPDLARGRDDLVLAHLGHRLVQLCARLLRAEVWAPTEHRKLSRCIACVVPSGALDHPVLLAHARLVLLARDGSILHEELIAAGGHLREGDFHRIAAPKKRAKDPGGDLARVLALADTHQTPAPEAVLQPLLDLWPRHQTPLLAALEATMATRSRALADDLAERADKEAADLAKVLGDLLTSLRAALEENPVQFDLFDNSEHKQLSANRQAMTLRAEALPHEIQRDTAALRERYRDPTPRLFPVALTYLIPERLVGRSR
jgi:superfamily II DNA or RNA helicase